MKKEEKARELFLSGYNCAQSVVLTFADDLRISKEVAQKIAAGFGGGMGKQQETCGAVTGGVMVLGLLRGEEVNNNEDLKKRAYSGVKEFTGEFISTFKSSKCRDIIQCDLNTPEGEKRFREEKIMETVCSKCVERAVSILETVTRE